MCAAVLAAVVGVVGVQSAAAETEAEAISQNHRNHIDICLERYEEDIEEAEDYGITIILQGYDSLFSEAMKYKEWTKADSDKYSALKQRHKKLEQSMAAAAAGSPREKIDTYLNLYEEATETFEAGDKDAGQKKLIKLSRMMGDASVLMHYKEWTQADSDRMAALTERAQNAAWSDEQKAYVKKAMEEPHVSQELLNAIWRDDAAAIKKLIAQGEDPNGVKIGSQAPVLWDAVSANKPKAAKALIESGADVLFKFQNTNATLLHTAAVREGTELLTILLDAGAKKYVNEVSNDGTPAMVATFNGNFEALKVLVSYGADVNKKDKDGKSILFYAINSEKPERSLTLVKYLVEKGTDKKPIKDASLLMNCIEFASLNDVSKYFIDLGANVNAKFERRLNGFEDMFDNGGTPLIEAARCGNVDGVKMLVQAGANVNLMAGRKTKITALQGVSLGWLGNTYHHAGTEQYKNSTEIVKFLIQSGADVNKKNSDGETPLMTAAGTGSGEICETLIKAGAKVNERGGEWNETPLVYAGKSGHGCNALVELLRKKYGAWAVEPKIAAKARTGCNGYSFSTNLDYDFRDAVEVGGIKFNVSDVPTVQSIDISTISGTYAFMKEAKNNGGFNYFNDFGTAKIAADKSEVEFTRHFYELVTDQWEWVFSENDLYYDFYGNTGILPYSEFVTRLLWDNIEYVFDEGISGYPGGELSFLSPFPKDYYDGDHSIKFSEKSIRMSPDGSKIVISYKQSNDIFSFATDDSITVFRTILVRTAK